MRARWLTRPGPILGGFAGLTAILLATLIFLENLKSSSSTHIPERAVQFEPGPSEIDDYAQANVIGRIKKRTRDGDEDVNRSEVLENSTPLISALDPNRPPQKKILPETKTDQLKAFLQATGTTSRLRQSIERSGSLKAMYGSINFDGSVTVEIEQQIEAIRNLILEHRDFFGLGAAGDIENVEITCTSNMCSAHVSKSFLDVSAPSHGLSFSYKDGEIFAIQGKFDVPKLSMDNPPESFSHDEALIEISRYFETDPDSVHLGEQLGQKTIESRGEIDFFGERWESVWIDDVPYLIIFNGISRKVVSVEILLREAQVNASGEDLSGTVRSFNAEEVSNGYEMLDKSFPSGHQTSVHDFAGYSLRELYQLSQDGESTPEEIVFSSAANIGWDAAAVTLLNSARETIEYYKASHSYDAVVQTGSDLRLAVNAGKSNASFLGGTYQIGQFGIGDGIVAAEGTSFAKAKDVVGHEINHGVVSVTSGLEYKNQSGALDESYSDFFGAVIEGKNWLLGEDLNHPSGLALRNMANPLAAISSQPSHMADYVHTQEDSGGVHTNSGIHNRGLYLISEGLSEENLGVSIGVTKTADLAFRTMIGLSKNATLDDSANLMFQNAVSKYGEGSPESNSVLQGMQVVGLLQAIATEVEVESEISFDVQGSNSMIYLRPYYGADEEANPYSDYYYVYVQIFANDDLSFDENSNYGSFTSDKWSAYTRPTLVNYQDGSYRLVFVGKDGQTYFYGTDYTDVIPLEYDYEIEDITYSPDGSLLAWVIADSPYIYIYDYNSEQISSVRVALPTTNKGGEDLPVRLIDTVRFGPSSRKVAFDYLLCDLQSPIACDEEGAINNWSVGVLDAATMEVSFPFAGYSSRYDIGFPTFPNLTDRFIAVDLVDNQADTESGYYSAIYLYDLDEQTWNGIVGTDGKSQVTGHYGTPSFSSDDSAVIFSYDTDQGPLIYAASLVEYQLAETGNVYSLLNPSEAAMPFVVPLISVEKKPTLSVDQAIFDFGDVLQGGVSEPLEVCIENLGEFSISISSNETLANYAISGLFDSVIEGKQKKCTSIALRTAGIQSGSFDTTLSLIHDGLNGPTPLTLKGYVDIDTDSDGILNYKDIDDDDDEVLDADDAFPLISVSGETDTDADGAPNTCDSDCLTAGMTADTDDDGDGTLDTADAFPLDSAETTDTDSDGTGNNADTDDDGDGVADGSDAFPLDSAETVDTDSDGTGNNADTDDDADGVLDTADAFPLISVTGETDTDADGAPNTCDADCLATGMTADTDDDADGVLDTADAFPLISVTGETDTDADGAPNTCEADCIATGMTADTDDDADGVLDTADAFPLISVTGETDTDADGAPNTCDADCLATGMTADTDDDADGVLDTADAFPLISVTGETDTDADGAPNTCDADCIATGMTADTDDDGDTYSDGSDAFPLDSAEWIDTDSDGTGNNADTDDDGDTYSDGSDAFPLDSAEWIDTDSDGTGNNADTDDDNDGLSDDEEGGLGTDPVAISPVGSVS